MLVLPYVQSESVNHFSSTTVTRGLTLTCHEVFRHLFIVIGYTGVINNNNEYLAEYSSQLYWSHVPD